MPTWSDIIDFPTGICITGCEINARNATGVRQSPYSYKQEVQVFSGQIMEMSVSFKQHDAETGSKLEAFFLKLRGMAGRFRFGDPFHSMPMGEGRGVPVIAASITAGNQTITTSGWTPSTENQLKAGDYLEINERLYRTLDDVHSDEQGMASITLWPDTRHAFPVGQQIKIRNTRGVWRLTEESISYSRTVAGQKHHTSMTIIEAL